VAKQNRREFRAPEKNEYGRHFPRLLLMNRKKVIWMCSGQGSQYFRMGEDLFEQDPVFRECIDSCSRVAEPWLGASLPEILYRKGVSKADWFDDTLQSGVAVCSIQYAMAQSLLRQGFQPDCILGYSIGEVSATIIAGVLTLEEGLNLIHQHATLVEAHCPPGGMLAVLASPDRIRPAVESVPAAWIAAHNFENHSVVAGDIASLELLLREFQSQNLTTMKLPVRRAFHSPMMDTIENKFLTSIRNIPERPLAFEVVSASHGHAGKASSIVESLWDATRKPVWFREAIRRLEENEHAGSVYLDVGPAGTLATFLKYNANLREGSEIYTSITPFGDAEKNLCAYRMAVR
jgi:acyl transferase domain-containing protein